MYVHQHHLKHLLHPRHYHDPAHYHQRELQYVFRPGWHLVASRRDVARPGDFITFELLGEPLILKNMGGELCAFQNVCAHRHCQLTGLARGHDPRLRCQYHGWEYDAEGRTGKIPDARCFRPLDRESAHLQKFRVATCGELVFVSLAETGPSLAEHLGPVYESMVESFQPPFQPAWIWQTEIDANWKIPVENTVEMYHLPCVHPKSLREYKDESHYEHTLQDHCSTMRHKEYIWHVSLMQNWLFRRLGGKPTNMYTHHLTHPNTVFLGTDVMRMAESFVPTSPTTCRQIVWAYSYRGRVRGPLSYAVSRFLRIMVRKITHQILMEDMPLFNQVQRGMYASRHPGLIGTLEERIYAFQKDLLRACEAHPEPLVLGTTTDAALQSSYH